MHILSFYECNQLLRDSSFYKGIVSMLDGEGIEPIIRGWTMQSELTVDLKFNDEIQNRLVDAAQAPPAGYGKPEDVNFDLVSVSIARGRDLGLADYITWRKAYNLSEPKTWSDITSDPAKQAFLQKLYAGNISNIDAYIGALAEDVQSGILPPLMAASVYEQFLRTRAGDRFWYQKPGVLTAEELAELGEAPLSPSNSTTTKETTEAVYSVKSDGPTDVQIEPNGEILDALPNVFPVDTEYRLKENLEKRASSITNTTTSNVTPVNIKLGTPMTLGRLVRSISNGTIPCFPNNPFAATVTDLIPFACSSTTPDTTTVSTTSTDALNGFDGMIRVTADYFVKWKFVNSTRSGELDSIKFQMISNYTGWFGLGLGQNMYGADLYIAQPRKLNATDPQWIVVDAHSYSTAGPIFDVQDGGQNSIADVRDLTRYDSTGKPILPRTLAFRRKLNTGDILDTIITNTTVTKTKTSMMFAFSRDSPELKYHGSSNRMRLEVDLFAASSKGPTVLEVKAPTSSNRQKVLMLHGFIMFVTFAFIYPAGLYIARYTQHVARWLDLHRTLMTAITSNVLVIAATAFLTEGDLSTTHSKIGISMTLILISIMAAGYASAYWPSTWDWKYTYKTRTSHWLLGYFGYALGVTNGFLGARDLTNLVPEIPTSLPYFYLAFGLSVPILLVIYGEYTKITAESGSANSSFDMLTRNSTARRVENLPIFEWADINNRVALGAKWIIIKGIVYDCERYMKRHPGGKQLLLSSIGLDVTENFYGKRSGTALGRMSSTVKRSTTTPPSNTVDKIHQHSRLAQFFLQTMAVGRLREDPPTLGKHRSRNGSAELGHSGESNRQVIMKTNAVDDDGSSPGLTKRGAKGRPSKTTIGEDVEQGKVSDISHHSKTKRNGAPKLPLNMERFQTYQLSEKSTLTKPRATRAVCSFKFTLPNPDHDVVYFRPGENVQFQFVDEDGKVVTRCYTPIRCENRGSMEFYIKLYQGEMTTYLERCKQVRIRGPLPGIDLLNPHTDNACWESIGCIVGGTGLTPVLLLIDYHIRHARRDPVTNTPLTKIHILNFNTTENDFFGLEYLESLEKDSMGTLTITHVVRDPPPQGSNFKGLTGSLTDDMVRATMPRPPLPVAATESNMLHSPPSLDPSDNRTGSMKRNKHTRASTSILRPSIPSPVGSETNSIGSAQVSTGPGKAPAADNASVNGGLDVPPAAGSMMLLPPQHQNVQNVRMLSASSRRESGSALLPASSMRSTEFGFDRLPAP
ncbi:hypothetical protein HK102_014013, partial [Quaeritorhiza haematococci]